MFIRINKSAEEVFDFTMNPANTHLWIDGVSKETADEYPPNVGTNYRNWDHAGEMNEYKVTQFDRPKTFQLDATQKDYKVRYTFTPISVNETELEYFEWSESNKLHSPFMQEILEKLKEVVERE